MKRLLLLLLLTACQAPSTDEPLVPLPVYRAWYAEVEACAGVSGDFDQLRFYVLEPEDERAGVTYNQAIWLKSNAVGSRLIVEHEMLHSLIGDGDHSSTAWKTCGLDPETLVRLLG